MQYTNEQRAELKSQFARKRRSQMLVVAPLLVAFLLLLSSEGEQAILGVPVAIAAPVGVVVVVGALVFSLFNWRCPACNGYLGKAISPKFCSKCGVELS